MTWKLMSNWIAANAGAIIVVLILAFVVVMWFFKSMWWTPFALGLSALILYFMPSILASAGAGGTHKTQCTLCQDAGGTGAVCEKVTANMCQSRYGINISQYSDNPAASGGAAGTIVAVVTQTPVPYVAPAVKPDALSIWESYFPASSAQDMSDFPFGVKLTLSPENAGAAESRERWVLHISYPSDPLVVDLEVIISGSKARGWPFNARTVPNGQISVTLYGTAPWQQCLACLDTTTVISPPSLVSTDTTTTGDLTSLATPPIAVAPAGYVTCTYPGYEASGKWISGWAGEYGVSLVELKELNPGLWERYASAVNDPQPGIVMPADSGCH